MIIIAIIGVDVIIIIITFDLLPISIAIIDFYIISCCFCICTSFVTDLLCDVCGGDRYTLRRGGRGVWRAARSGCGSVHHEEVLLREGLADLSRPPRSALLCSVLLGPRPSTIPLPP